jgi:hypothetical protein
MNCSIQRFNNSTIQHRNPVELSLGREDEFQLKTGKPLLGQFYM